MPGEMLPAQARVLIADSDLKASKRLHSALLDAGVFADASFDTEAVVGRMATRPYAILLLDVCSPVIDPQSVLEKISELPQEWQPVVVALGTAEAARHLESERIHIVLKKPLVLGQLTELVRNCIREVAGGESEAPPGERRPDFRR
jgi:DNA-binding NtrC family response regulator